MRPLLPAVSLPGVSLSGVSLSGVSLSGVSLSGVSLSGVSLSGVSLAGVSLCLLLGCSDYSVREAPPAPPADPSVADDHDFGEPPDWSSCKQGLMADFSNLSADHPDVQDLLPEPQPLDTSDSGWEALRAEDQDWWDHVAFTTFEYSLEYGPGWAPVDEGLADDPRFFAVRWYGWLRVTKKGEIPFVLGGSTDVWVTVGDTEIAHLQDSPYDPQLHSASLKTGQYPFEIRYAHRAGDELGFRFRFTEGEVVMCPGVK